MSHIEFETTAPAFVTIDIVSGAVVIAVALTGIQIPPVVLANETAAYLLGDTIAQHQEVRVTRPGSVDQGGGCNCNGVLSHQQGCPEWVLPL
jgi:hypothetical protein